MSDVVIKDVPEEVQSPEALKSGDVFDFDENRRNFAGYIQKEITAVRDGEDTREFLDSVAKWRRQRIARPENKTKNYPFPNSANISPPITAQKVNTIYAKALSNFSVKRPFWSGESADPAFTKNVEALARYMNIISASPFDLNLESLNRKILYDCVSLGTEFYEVVWDYKQVTYIDDSGSSQFRTLHNGPTIIPIPIEDFFTRPYWVDLQSSPWVARRFRLTRAELSERKASGRYTDVDAIMTSPTQELSDREEIENEIQGIQATPTSDYPETELYDLYAFHAFWDVNSDGVLEDIKGVIELETGTILRVEPNTLGIRLIGRIPYQEIPGQLYGVGVCHACEFLQDEGETIHNMRVDGLRLSMLNMYVGRRGSGIRNDETVYPGKIWLVDQPDDFKPVSFPDLSGSSYQAENLVRDYADRITGANDPMSGFADQTLKSGGGAQAQMMMTQQASSILNAQLDTMEEYYAEMGRMIAVILAVNIDLVTFQGVSEEDIALIKELLAVPIEELPSKIKFKIETTDAARTESAKRENYAAFMGLYTQYSQTMLQYGQLAFTPNIPPVLSMMVQRFMVGQTDIAAKMIEFLKIGDPARFLPNMDPVDAQLRSMEGVADAGVGSRPGSGQGVGPVRAVGAQPEMGGGPMGPMAGSAGVPGGLFTGVSPS